MDLLRSLGQNGWFYNAFRGRADGSTPPSGIELMVLPRLVGQNGWFYPAWGGRTIGSRGCFSHRPREVFTELVDGIMKANEDFCWIMCGRHEPNHDKIKAILGKLRWKTKCFHFVYDARLLQKWYWRRMRGLANSKSVEKVLLCWKGRQPEGLPRSRQYVDKDTPLYNEVVLKVPVIAPKDLTFVGKDVREVSLRTMGGVVAEDIEEQDGFGAGSAPDDQGAASAPAADQGEGEQTNFAQHVKRRRLYRQTTGTDVAWFPHDNAADLLKEIVWESGGEKVRWVLHGTPASGAGIVGVLEMGASVVCLCEDAHHKKGFEQALQERCVEVMLAGSRVFKDADLQARAAKLCPAVAGRAKAGNKKGDAKKDDDAPKDDDDPKKAAKGSKAKGSKKKDSPKRKKKQAPAKTQKKQKKSKKSAEDDEDEDDEEDEDSEDSEEDEEEDEEED